MISSAQPSHIAHNPDQAIIRALSSITSEQADLIAGSVHASGQAWDVQAVDDYDGYLSILIEPNTVACDRPAYFISGTAQCLELSEAHNDDRLVPLKAFTNVGDLSAYLMGLV